MSIVSNNTTQQQVSTQLLQNQNGASASASTSSTASTDPNSPAALQASFLQLLVTQLQNQDPTNPMDSSQMTSQLAEINTVSGISQMNTTLSSLATQLNASPQVWSSSLIGKNVLVPGTTDTVSQGVAQPTGVYLGAAASAVTVTITDSQGNHVKTINLGAEPAGSSLVNWDGTSDTGTVMPDGTYNVAVSATTSAGQSVAATTLSYDTVSSVVTNPDGTVGLDLAGGTQTSLSSIAQIL